MTLLARPRDRIRSEGTDKIGAEQLTRADTVRSELTSIQTDARSLEILPLSNLNKRSEEIAVGISKHTKILCLGSIPVYQW
jgi:hypothetical protein